MLPPFFLKPHHIIMFPAVTERAKQLHGALARREGEVLEELGAFPFSERQSIEHLIPGYSLEKISDWPPDAFAVAAHLLQKSGAYAVVLDDWEPHDDPDRRVSWEREARKLGVSWRRAAGFRKRAPKRVQGWWTTVLSFRNL